MKMDEKIHLSDLSLAESIRETARWNEAGEIREQGDLLLTRGISRFPTTSVAMDLSKGQDHRAEETFERIRSFYRERKSAFSLHLRNHADGALEFICRRENMTLISDSPGMVLTEPCPDKTPPRNIDVRQVDSVSGVADFTSVIIESFASLGMPPTVGEKIFATPERLLQPHIRMVIARDEGKPVAAAMVIHSQGIAGIYWVGTVPAARGRGLGEACVGKVVNDAFLRGARLVVLQASKFGAPLYLRMGFETVTRYPWYMCLEK